MDFEEAFSKLENWKELKSPLSIAQSEEAAQYFEELLLSNENIKSLTHKIGNKFQIKRPLLRVLLDQAEPIIINSHNRKVENQEKVERRENILGLIQTLVINEKRNSDIRWRGVSILLKCDMEISLQYFRERLIDIKESELPDVYDKYILSNILPDGGLPYLLAIINKEPLKNNYWLFKTINNAAGMLKNPSKADSLTIEQLKKFVQKEPALDSRLIKLFSLIVEVAGRSEVLSSYTRKLWETWSKEDCDEIWAPLYSRLEYYISKLEKNSQSINQSSISTASETDIKAIQVLPEKQNDVPKSTQSSMLDREQKHRATEDFCTGSSFNKNATLSKQKLWGPDQNQLRQEEKNLSLASEVHRLRNLLTNVTREIDHFEDRLNIEQCQQRIEITNLNERINESENKNKQLLNENDRLKDQVKSLENKISEKDDELVQLLEINERLEQDANIAKSEAEFAVGNYKHHLWELLQVSLTEAMDESIKVEERSTYEEKILLSRLKRIAEVLKNEQIAE